MEIARVSISQYHSMSLTVSRYLNIFEYDSIYLNISQTSLNISKYLRFSQYPLMHLLIYLNISEYLSTSLHNALHRNPL